MIFYRKLPIPKEIKEMLPVAEKLVEKRKQNIAEIEGVLAGSDRRFLLIIGPCSADDPDAVLLYLEKLRRISEQVRDKLVLIPRVYTAKPRSSGLGYKGLLHQPDPLAPPDLLSGLIATRKLHIRALEEFGFSCADEMLYPENHRYYSDLLAYVAVGARSAEDQQHRQTASGLSIPVGMKNPVGSYGETFIRSIEAVTYPHIFTYRGWEVKTAGNPLAHGILRGYTDEGGAMHPNYGYDCLTQVTDAMQAAHIATKKLIIDTNHANSGKDFSKQPEIALDVLASRKRNADIAESVCGLMIESYLLDGAQPINSADLPGKSITDPCLGWEKTEDLILRIANEV